MEIVLHEGVYRGDVRIAGGGRGAAAALPPLELRAARSASGGFEPVVFDGSVRVSSASPVEGTPGVYAFRAPGVSPGRQLQVWEEDTRTRYDLVADRAAVARYAGSYWYTQPRKAGAVTVYVHTSDGKAPSAHRLRRSDGAQGILVERANVTLRGLRFRGFLAWRYSAGVVSKAPGTRIEASHVENSVRGFTLGRGADRGAVVGCTAEDVATGVYVQADDATVERCTLRKRRDSFTVPSVRQKDAAIEFYYEGRGGTVRSNLAVGFHHGLFIKTRQSRFIVEGNTFLHPEPGGKRGIGPNRWHPKSIYRSNLVAGYAEPFGRIRRLPPTTSVEGNCIEPPPGKGGGKGLARAGRLARPVFVDAEGGDYRLAHGSACASAGPKGGPAGARGVAPPEVEPTGVPQVHLSLAPPGRKADEEASAKEGLWLAPERKVTLRLRSEDPSGRLRGLRVRVGAGDWSDPEPWTERRAVTLPPAEEPTAVRVAARDARGAWHELEALRVLAGSGGPVLVGSPESRSSEHGFVVAVHADRPSTLRLEYGRSPALGAATTARLEPGAEERPAAAGAAALVPPAVERGARYHWRLVLRDALGRETTVPGGTFELSGAPETLHVAPEGRDEAGRGGRAEPYAALEYAARRALPGDRLLLHAGLHTEPARIARGGLPEAPLRIEAEEAGAVVLDGRGRARSLLRLDGAPDVRVEGLELRWFERAAVELHDSPGVVLEGNRIWNAFWYGWVDGDGIRARKSPGITLHRNVIYRTQKAIWLRASPEARITHNTTAGNMHGGVQLLQSVRGTLVRSNSLAFEGISALRIAPEDEAALEAFESDWNNLGLHFRKPLSHELVGVREDRSNLEAPEGVLGEHNSKFLVQLERVPERSLKAMREPAEPVKVREASARDLRFYQLEDWRRAAGQDRHSIFADPRYVDPRTGDFRLRPGSPNIGAGHEGSTIGALGVAR